MATDDTPTPRESGTWMFYTDHCKAFELRLRAVLVGLRSTNVVKRDTATADRVEAMIWEFSALGRDFEEWRDNPRLAATQRAEHIPRYGQMQRQCLELLGDISKKWKVTV